MDGSHLNSLDFDVEKEQRDIEQLIQSLIQFKPPEKANKDIPLTPKSVRPKARGRPPLKTASTAESPSLSSAPADGVPLSSLRDIFVECLTKINNQNKFLVNKVTELESVVFDQNRKIEELKTATTNCDSLITQCKNQDVPPLLSPSPSQSVLSRVVERVDKIENNINSHMLLCRGPTVSSKLTTILENGLPNVDQIKADLCTEIFEQNVSKISVDSFDVSLYGRNRNLLKIECRSTGIRDYIIEQARLRKPKGIYIVDFLSSEKLQIYQRLNNLRKRFPDQITALFTRRGDIFGKVGPEKKIVKFSSLVDVQALPLRDATEATLVPPPPPPHRSPPSPAAGGDESAE